MVLWVMVAGSGNSTLVKPWAGEMSIGSGGNWMSRERRGKDGLLLMAGIM